MQCIEMSYIGTVRSAYLEEFAGRFALFLIKRHKFNERANAAPHQSGFRRSSSGAFSMFTVASLPIYLCATQRAKLGQPQLVMALYKLLPCKDGPSLGMPVTVLARGAIDGSQRRERAGTCCGEAARLPSHSLQCHPARSSVLINEKSSPFN